MTSYPPLDLAPELQIQTWFNAPSPVSLASERGKVVVIEAFQMLCPGCVSHGLPQAMSIQEVFPRKDVTVLGLHSVFEHHDAMQPHALEAFLHEYRIGFPVGVDQPADEGRGTTPKTMTAYQLRGTPSLLVIDRAGRLRINHFGQVSDMRIAAVISRLIYEDTAVNASDPAEASDPVSRCTPDGCTV